MSLNVLSLFSGIGGLELGLERAGMTTVGQVEINDYCRRVLAKHWPHVPRHDDVRTAAAWWLSTERPAVDVICGGFPCQDISDAGLKVGIGGRRSGLWSAMHHTVRVLRPQYIVVENVAAILVRGLDVVAGDLAEIGYDLEWDCVPAAAIGAPHRRDRWFGIAYPHADRRGQSELTERYGESEWPDDGTQRDDALRLHQDVADADGAGPPWRPGQADRRPRKARRVEPERLGDGRPWQRPTPSRNWASEPDVGRVAHGIPARVDRLRALGNAVVPQVAEHVGRLIVDHALECAQHE